MLSIVPTRPRGPTRRSTPTPPARSACRATRCSRSSATS